MLETRLAEMHLGIDHAREHGQARGVDHLSSLRSLEGPETGDLSIPHGNIQALQAAGRKDLGPFDDQIECVGHEITSRGRTWRSLPQPRR